MQLTLFRRVVSLSTIAFPFLALVCSLAAVAFPQPLAAATATRDDCVAGPCAANRRVFVPLVSRAPVQAPADLFGLQTYGDLSGPGAALDQAQTANANWLRTQLSWAAVEPKRAYPHVYHWGPYDASFARARYMGFKLIVTITANPKWAAQYSQGPVNADALGDFRDFMSAVVERYDGDGVNDAPGSPVVHHWEFYNEPDGGDPVRAERGEGYWGHYGNLYANLLCIVRPAMKAADEQAQVVFGGIAYDYFDDNGGPFVRSFPKDVLAKGGGNCFDVMAFHYYPVFASGWSMYGPGLAGKANYLRSLLAAYGVTNKPMFCTESGWHSDVNFTPPSTPQEQANYVPKLFAQAAAAGVQNLTWWTWIDPGPLVGSFGLVTTDLAPKPAYYAYRTAAVKLGQAQFERTMTAGELGGSGLEGHIFRADRPLYVVWANDGVEHPVRFAASALSVTNVDASSVRTVTDAADGASDGWVTVRVGSGPLYIEVTQPR